MKNIKTFYSLFIIILLFSINNVSAFSVNTNNSQISTYESEKGIATFFGDNNRFEITLNKEGTAYIEYKVSGFDPNKVYAILADLMVTNVSGKGAVVGTKTIENNSITYGFSPSLTGTTDWKQCAVTTIPNEKGELEIFIGFAYNNQNSIGDVKITNIMVVEASEISNVMIRESKNKRIKMVLIQEDFKNAGITENQLQNYLDLMEQACYKMEELTGNSKYGKLYPNKRRQIVYTMTNTHEYGALAGYPIHVNGEYASSLLQDAKIPNKISWTFLHEMGHLFDWPLSTIDGKYVTSANRFSRDIEQSGSFYPLYAIKKLNLITENNENFDAFLTNRKKYYHEYLEKGNFYGDGYNYLLTTVKDKNNNIDWEAFKKTYEWFNNLDEKYYSEKINKTVYSRTLWFLKKLDDYSSYNVSKILENNTIARAILSNKLSYSQLDIKNSKTLLKDKKIDISYFPDANDIVVYKSSNEELLKVDDNGNLWIKENATGSVTITYSSFLNPSLVKNVVVQLNNKTNDNNTITDNNNNDTTNNNDNINDDSDKNENDLNNNNSNNNIQDGVIIENSNNNSSGFIYIDYLIYIIIGLIVVIILYMVFKKKRV